MGSVNVGIVGVGNCASALVQGVVHYSGASAPTTGLRARVCAGYDLSDIRFTSAFDVNRAKIGLDLATAIWTAPNNALRFADVSDLGVTVGDGILADGIGRSLRGVFEVAGDQTVHTVAERLRQTDTHILVSFLPVGSQLASELYAESALLAGCAYINCMPAVLARAPEWLARFAEAGLPLIGDDLKSQFGSTLVHHALVHALASNGVGLSSTYQLNSGGNMDFLNMQDDERMRTKQESKAQGMLADRRAGMPGTDVHVGAEYVPFLADRKVAFIRLEGVGFGGTPIEIDVRMSIEDSPSGAGNVLDAVRYAKFALDHSRPEVVAAASAMFMKAPPVPMTDDRVVAVLQEAR